MDCLVRTLHGFCRFLFVLPEIVFAVPLHRMTSHNARVRAAGEMSAIFWFHMRVMGFMVLIQLIAPKSGVLFFVMATFANSFCLAERFWEVQLRFMAHWQPWCQCVFVVSRLALVTLAVLACLLWIRMCWVMGALRQERTPYIPVL
jgi:hypothetical protein